MSEKPSGSLEMTIVLPLGVVAGKLRRIEDELRQLNLDLSSFDRASCSERSARSIEAQVEEINEVLESIKRLTSNLEFEEPAPTSRARSASDDEYLPKNGKRRVELDD